MKILIWKLAKRLSVEGWNENIFLTFEFSSLVNSWWFTKKKILLLKFYGN